MNQKMQNDAQITLPDIALFSVKTASLATSFSEKYWRKRIGNGEVKTVSIGRSIRIKHQVLLEFLEREIKKGGIYA